MHGTIFDIGFHQGEDTAYYLHLGYHVVAVDANPAMVEAARVTFKKEVEAGWLILLNYAVCDTDNGTAELHISDTSHWTSLRSEVARRENRLNGTITVPACRLATIVHRYGCPFYCKIDIEGYDSVAVRTLKPAGELPRYVSVETECIGDSEVISEEQALGTLSGLYEIGYRCFKLVEQRSLVVLSDKLFYGVNPDLASASHKTELKIKHGYDFPMSASGPFGPGLEGAWVDYSAARELLLFHRRTFFEQPGVPNYTFWCDWHATF